MNFPAGNFCIWPWALPPCRLCRRSPRRKPIPTFAESGRRCTPAVHSPTTISLQKHRWAHLPGRAVPLQWRRFPAQHQLNRVVRREDK